MTGGRFGFGGGVGIAEVLAVLLLRRLLAQCLQLLGLGAEAADFDSAGLRDEIAHVEIFSWGIPGIQRRFELRSNEPTLTASSRRWGTGLLKLGATRLLSSF